MEGFTRPEAIVLPEGATVPDKNLISPAPNRFTHRLLRPQPYYFLRSQTSTPNGEFPEGTEVVLLRQDDARSCRVADGRGLYVEIEFDSLAELK